MQQNNTHTTEALEALATKEGKRTSEQWAAIAWSDPVTAGALAMIEEGHDNHNERGFWPIVMERLEIAYCMGDADPDQIEGLDAEIMLNTAATRPGEHRDDRRARETWERCAAVLWMLRGDMKFRKEGDPDARSIVTEGATAYAIATERVGPSHHMDDGPKDTDDAEADLWGYSWERAAHAAHHALVMLCSQSGDKAAWGWAWDVFGTFNAYRMGDRH